MPREVTATTTQPTDDMCGARPVASRVRQLTPKQARFVQEYLVDLNATQAAIRAGYSRKTASWIGPQLLGKTHVAQEIEKGSLKRQARTEVTQDMVIRELARIAFSDVRKLYREDGSMKNLSELDDDTAATLAGIETLEEFMGAGGDRCLIGHTKKGRLWDKGRALELLGKHLGMFVDRSKVEVDGGLDIRVSYDDSGDG